MYFDEKEVENVNKGDGRFNNHVELKWKMYLMNGKFYNLDTIRSIVDILENESSIKDLVDMLSFFVKLNSNLYLPTK